MRFALLRPDQAALADLARFAAIEAASLDIEPWADYIAALYARGHLGDREQALWLIKLYNTYDDIASGWQCMMRWPYPTDFDHAPGREFAGTLPSNTTRRNLRGANKAVRHLDSYIEALRGFTQSEWLRQAITAQTSSPRAAFADLTTLLRRIWGTGRLSAFEWAEYVIKVTGFPALCADAQLWESSGPRTSLQRLYGCENPDRAWLHRAAWHCREFLAESGTALEWVDFETVVCDFNVMREGRYYPGRHLAAMRAEVCSIAANDPDAAEAIEATWHAVVPEPWNTIRPGVDRMKLTHYRETGKILDTP